MKQESADVLALREDGVHECPYQQWYKFKQCGIRSCKNFTDQTKSRCIGVDRVRPEGTKIISDSEIHLYKFPDAGISTRLVQIKRKKAIDRVKAILILREYIAYIRDNKESGGLFNMPLIAQAEAEYPLKIRRLGWENWMWEYALDESVWKEFAAKKQGECSEFHLYQLFAMKLTRFERLLREFNKGAAR